MNRQRWELELRAIVLDQITQYIEADKYKSIQRGTSGPESLDGRETGPKPVLVKSNEY